MASQRQVACADDPAAAASRSACAGRWMPVRRRGLAGTGDWRTGKMATESIRTMTLKHVRKTEESSGRRRWLRATLQSLPPANYEARRQPLIAGRRPRLRNLIMARGDFQRRFRHDHDNRDKDRSKLTYLPALPVALWEASPRPPFCSSGRLH
ncbi:uncharacterized protein LOC119593891 [Penaeus monodon]|uniref:uncharacterized protein LOC119593891 n=1 Tax=Penaeus monodon TaxID=6687 RepID=UPI0018A7ADFC|nr:uncharacterized protein LOC119593891 [Penaeus monodon]